MVVSQLRTSDVSDPRVIEAMNQVAREKFVPVAQRNLAYADRGVQIGNGRALNAPLTTGRLLNVSQLDRSDHVLLIGAATGYTAAVIAQLAGSVVAVEQSSRLAKSATENLANLDNVTTVKADHAKGYAENGPYSVIIIDGVVEQVSPELVEQLEDNGRLAAAILENGVSRLALGRKAGSIVGYQYFADCGGCSLPGLDKTKSFEF